jgi:hypothetical protein
MIVVEGANWANDWSVFSSPFDDNMVYQFHYYCWDHPNTLKNIQKYLNQRKRFNAPVWVGETGEADDAIYWATTEYFEANNIGWSFWPWKKMGAVNGPYSIKIPAGWQVVQNYTEGGSEKPSTEAAQKTFDELLLNVRLENCAFRPDVVNAMFRRIPGKVEAKDYGQDGQNKSYFVKNTSKNAEYYRTSEPVPISLVDKDQKNSEEVVSLRAGEWTAYTVDCATASNNYEAIVRARAEDIPAAAQLIIDDLKCDVKISTNVWSEINLGTHPLSSGRHRLKWLVQEGTVQVSWFELRLKPINELSAKIDPTIRE